MTITNQRTDLSETAPAVARRCHRDRAMAARIWASPLSRRDAAADRDARARVAGGLAILLWWLFFSRAPWLERVGAVVLMVVAVAVTKLLVPCVDCRRRHGRCSSTSRQFPWLSLALVGVGGGHTSPHGRTSARVAWSPPSSLALRAVALIRTGGTVAGGGSELHWRWTPTAEERLLAQGSDEPLATCACSSRSRRRHRLHRLTHQRKPAPTSSRRRTGSGTAVPPQPRRTGGCRVARRTASRVARLSRTRPRQRHSRRADRHRLVRIAAGRDLAPANRTGLVVVRGPRRPPLHAGAARRRRDRRLLQGVHRRAGVAAPRPGALLGVEWRRRSARDADAQQRPRLRLGRDRDPERARRRAPARVVWSRNVATDAKVDTPIWGFSGSPLVIDDLVIVAAVRRAGRVRPRHRRAPLARSVTRGQLQLAASRDDRRRRADRAAGRARRDQRRAGRRQAALGAHVGRAAPSCSRR